MRKKQPFVFKFRARHPLLQPGKNCKYQIRSLKLKLFKMMVVVFLSHVDAAALCINAQILLESPIQTSLPSKLRASEYDCLNVSSFYEDFHFTITSDIKIVLGIARISLSSSLCSSRDSMKIGKSTYHFLMMVVRYRNVGMCLHVLQFSRRSEAAKEKYAS